MDGWSAGGGLLVEAEVSPVAAAGAGLLVMVEYAPCCILIVTGLLPPCTPKTWDNSHIIHSQITKYINVKLITKIKLITKQSWLYIHIAHIDYPYTLQEENSLMGKLAKDLFCLLLDLHR